MGANSALFEVGVEVLYIMLMEVSLMGINDISLQTGVGGSISFTLKARLVFNLPNVE
jgi:hypothetical protein